MGRNFDDYPGFYPMGSWANNYVQDCTYIGKRNKVFYRTNHGLLKIVSSDCPDLIIIEDGIPEDRVQK